MNQSKDKKMPFIDVNIGTDVSNLFPLEDLVAFLKSQCITHMQLYDVYPALLTTLTNTSIHVILGVSNNQLLALGSFNATTVARVACHILPSHPSTLICIIAIGDEVPNSLPFALPLHLPTVCSLSSTISPSSSSTNPLIKLSTPLPFSTILDPFPPSQAFFNQTVDSSFLLPPPPLIPLRHRFPSHAWTDHFPSIIACHPQ